MYEKEPHLNVAYYGGGPSIPPLKPSYHRLRSGGGAYNCGCRFFSLICKLILTIITVMGIVVILLGLNFRPNIAEFHITDAILTEFNYTNNTLHYDLALNISARNPNNWLDIYYSNIEVRALFHNARFNSKFLSPFYQGHKTTKVLNPVFKGQQALELNVDQIAVLKKENTSGIYKINVKMYLRVRVTFKFCVFNYKTMRLKPKVSCNLLVPLKGSVQVFKSTKCVQKVL